MAAARNSKSLPHMHLLIKGILHPDDAQHTMELGCDGLVVSNHGGRVLTDACNTWVALQAIRRRLNGLQATETPSFPIFLDSGVRSGTGIFSALANGATAVLVGRPFIWGLVNGGAIGVARVIKSLRDELEMTMALMGCVDLQSVAACLKNKETST
jgi:4-hydroxymandelate oxidase